MFYGNSASTYLITVFILSSIFNSDAAKFCYSGQNNGYTSRQCSQGGTDLDYTCQKFACEGGRSPFTLRTCARKNMGCLAGPRICQFSGGKGSCSRCDNDNSPFISRYCSDPSLVLNQSPCEASARMCLENFGNGSCYTCTNDLCNQAISLFQFHGCLAIILFFHTVLIFYFIRI